MIEDINPEDFDSDEAFESFIHENMLKCEYWYKSALDGGVATAGANLMLMYIDGIEGVLPPQPEKAKELDRIYAAKGRRQGLPQLPVFLRLRFVR